MKSVMVLMTGVLLILFYSNTDGLAGWFDGDEEKVKNSQSKIESPANSVQKIDKRVEKKTPASKTVDSPALDKSDEASLKIKAIEAQSKNIARIEKQLAAEKSQLAEMKKEFCVNFKNDCKKISAE